jgi:hypothetical protein
MMYAQPANMAKHQELEFCRLGNTRRQTGPWSLRPCSSSHVLSTVYVGEGAIERVTKFRYLGRILSQDDSDLSACVRNIQRKLQWAAVSKVLKREGVSKESFARLYKVIVSTVLLYGSDTWWSLDVWRNCSPLSTTDALRHITRRFIRCTDAEHDTWVTPSMTGVLAEAYS